MFTSKRFQYYWPKFSRGALGAIIMFDITNSESFRNAKAWIKKVRKNIGDIPIILLGNKVDLEENRVISFEEANHIVKSKRNVANPNESFKLQLIEYQKKRDKFTEVDAKNTITKTKKVPKYNNNSF